MSSPMQAALSEARFYGILDLGYVSLENAPAAALAMVRGGVQILQIRAKTHSPETIAHLARAIHPVSISAGVPLILNDHPALLRDVPAEGVHVGQDDMSVAEARKAAGREVLVGKSTHSIAQAVAAEEEEPDYLGFGPLFPTPTKPDYVPVGLTDISEVHRRVRLPLFCIGGVNSKTLDRVLLAGAKRVVVVSAILQASDIESYCREFATRL